MVAIALLVGVACSNEADPALYYSDCSSTQSCPAPYECVTYFDVHFDAERSVCLVPCQEAQDCAEGCVCKGKSGGASIGPDCYCICV